MPRRLIIPLVFLVTACSARAQEAAGHFDPVVYAGTFNLFQQWSNGAFLKPPHAVQYYTDSLFSYNQAVGFTMVTRDSAVTGWTMRMDFDADNYGALKLVRMNATKLAGTHGKEDFARLERWIQNVLGKKLFDRAAETPDRIRWKWMPRTGYEIVLWRIPSKDGESGLLRISLDRMVEK
jgi:hypothetical protein